MRCATITSEQIRSSGDSDAGWLIGPDGSTHPLPFGHLGRESNQGVSLLHASVSLAHASIENEQDGVWVKDLGSCNGTFVDNRRVEASELKSGDLLRFGEVSFYFTNAPAAETFVSCAKAETAPTLERGITVELKDTDPRVTVMLPFNQPAEIASDQHRVQFRGHEAGLVGLLVRRSLIARQESEEYASIDDVLEQILFDSQGSDAQNVRELVFRVRKKLTQAGLPDVIETRKGAGYRVFSEVALRP